MAFFSFGESTNPSVTQEPTKISSNSDNSKISVLPIILGIFVAVFIILAGLYIIFIEIPHRKRRKHYRENNSQNRNQEFLLYLHRHEEQCLHEGQQQLIIAHYNNHYTCAYDMALISKAAISIPEFRTITGTRTYQIPRASFIEICSPSTKPIRLELKSTFHSASWDIVIVSLRPQFSKANRFIRKTLTYDGAIGGKTGGTDEAKTTLVTFAGNSTFRNMFCYTI